MDAQNNTKSSSFIWIYIIALLVDVAVLLTGIILARPSMGMVCQMVGTGLIAAACLGLICLLATVPIALFLISMRDNTVEYQREMSSMMSDRLQSISVMINQVCEQQLISDRAKSVAFRVKDRDTVRMAVREEMVRGDWEAALVLVNDIESSFGYKQEADRLRQEIISKRDETRRRQLAEYLAPIDRHIQSEAWGYALQEAQTLMQRFPEDEMVRRLPTEIESRRQMRKQQLRDSWQEAVNRKDNDGSIEILKKLDLYLTPAEAESMQEIARNVFKEKREELRIRFSLAVQERRWLEAIRIGDEIMNDFPNTRIAQEVREKMDTLRQRASEPLMSPA